MKPQRGEVWTVDLGMAAKTRPALVVSVAPIENERQLVTIIPLTSSERGGRFEVKTSHRQIYGAFDPQGIVTVPIVRCEQRICEIADEEFFKVIEALRRWLDI